MNAQELIKREDFAATGIALPSSMMLDKLTGALVTVADLRLSGILGEELLTRYYNWRTDEDTPDDPANTDMAALHAKLRPFLVCEIMAEYYLSGNVSLTESGPVEKTVTIATPLTDEQRTAMRSKYESLARSYEHLLKKYVSTISGSSCAEPRVSRPRVTAVKPRNRAAFDYPDYPVINYNPLNL